MNHFFIINILLKVRMQKRQLTALWQFFLSGEQVYCYTKSYIVKPFPLKGNYDCKELYNNIVFRFPYNKVVSNFICLFLLYYVPRVYFFLNS